MSDRPPCGHTPCLFERHCLVEQAEVELLDVQADRAYREERGRVFALAFGLTIDEGGLFEVCLYSSDQRQRIRAAELLCMALGRVADRDAA